MIAPDAPSTCQRWELGRDSRVPAGELIRTSEYEVAEIDESTAKAFVTAHHYSKSYPAARFRHGLLRHGELVGAAVFSQPFTDGTIENMLPTIAPSDGVELGRLVLRDEVPGNGETWFLARCFELLRRRAVKGVVSFADPHPRSRLDGAVVFPGHVGTIYQALSFGGHRASYHGITERRTIRLLPDATCFSNFASGKIRRGLRGWRAAAQTLVRFGADEIAEDATADARITWLEYWRDALTRPVRHAGNHRYSWRIDAVPKSERAHGPVRAYPKRDRRAA